MNTRKIQAADIQAALREVRRNLGPDAVIISTRETAEGIEVTAASSQASLPSVKRKQLTEQSRAAADLPTQANSTTPIAAKTRKRWARSTSTASHPAFANLVSSMARPIAARAAGPDLASEFERLGLSKDVREAIAQSISESSREINNNELIDTAYKSIQSRIRTNGDQLMRDGGRVALLGGTGVGKTTTIAKLAAHFARRHGCESVALINADQYRIGASDQLRRFARLLGIAVADVHDAQQLKTALGKCVQRKLVLVDTAGLAHGDVRFAEQLRTFKDADLQCYLALSMNTQASVHAATIRAYEALAPRGLIFTKEDEALSLGGGLSMAVRHDLPISFVTTGPNVPADIRVAHAGKIIQSARAMADEELHLQTSTQTILHRTPKQESAQ